VGIKRMDHQGEKLFHFRLELKLLHCHKPHLASM
jgi:hypothetical protein